MKLILQTEAPENCSGLPYAQEWRHHIKTLQNNRTD